MKTQCPDCQKKLRISPPDETPEGTPIRIHCPCGARLRVKMPGRPGMSADDVLAKVRKLGQDLQDIAHRNA